MLGDEAVFGLCLIIYNFLSTLLTLTNINNTKGSPMTKLRFRMDKNKMLFDALLKQFCLTLTLKMSSFANKYLSSNNAWYIFYFILHLIKNFLIYTRVLKYQASPCHMIQNSKIKTQDTSIQFCKCQQWKDACAIGSYVFGSYDAMKKRDLKRCGQVILWLFYEGSLSASTYSKCLYRIG